MSYEKEPSTGNEEDRAIVGETSSSISASNRDLAAGKDLPVADLLDENLDEATPDEAILARPEWGSVAMAAMAGSFDMVVPAAMLAANYTIFRNADLRGDGSLTDGTGTLTNYFKEMFVQVDGDKKDGDGNDDDGWDDYVEAAQQRAERQRDLEETFSESQIDSMQWVGDPDEVWDLGGITASRKDLLAGAKAARSNLKKLATKDGWSDDQLIHETRLVSDYERAIIKHRYDDAAEAKRQMQPDTQQFVDQQTRKGITIAKGVSAETAQAATDAATAMTDATNARSDVLSGMAAAGTKSLKSEPNAALSAETEHGPALTNPPAIELTEEFSAVASNPEGVAPAGKPAQIADATPTPAPALNQSFSI